jgi:ADP-ribosylation factor-like protein 2
MGLLKILKKLKKREREIRVLILGLDNAGVRARVLRDFCAPSPSPRAPRPCSCAAPLLTALVSSRARAPRSVVRKKTTIVRKFSGEDITTIAPTLGFDIKTLEFRGYKLNVWDVGGQTTIRAYWRNYFEKTDGLVWVVDSSDLGRLQICKNELHALLGAEKLAGASLLIFANKQDLAGALSCDEIAKVLELGSPAFERRHWKIVPCSAVTGDGLIPGVDWLVDDISKIIVI